MPVVALPVVLMARCAGVIRTPVVQTARGARRDRVRDVVPMNARRAR